MSILKKIRKRLNKKYVQNEYIISPEITLTNIITLEDIENNKIFINNMKKHSWGNLRPKSILCFFPLIVNVNGGGISTILRLCYYLQKYWNAKIYLCFYPVVCDELVIKEFKINLKKFLPDFQYEIVNYNEVFELEVDIALCTFWLTAYPLLKFNNCKEKYYLVQDFESTFYASGVEYNLADATYKFGFNKLVNSNALKKLMQFTDNKAPVYRYLPGVDKNLYYPSDKEKSENKQLKIIVYGRPNTKRNAFEVLIPVFKSLKAKYGDKIHIISVGENYKLSNFGLEGIIENKGKFGSIEELAKLYRECDIGISLITTPTFSYQHLEFMASGLCLVTNEQDGIKDFLIDGDNAVVSPLLPEIMTEKISCIIENKELREKIAQKGYYYTKQLDWDKCFEGIADFIVNDKYN